MAQIVFIGGFGSNRSQVSIVADKLSDHYEQNVFAFSFSEAQKDLAHLARVARDSIVITHSAGLLLCEDMTPKEVIAIAPPVPGSLPVMAWRTLMKTSVLIRSGRISEDRAKRIRNYHKRTFVEHALRPHLNVARAGSVCRFDPAKLAVKLINRGVKVTLGFMDYDLLYPHSARHIHIDMARQYGAEIHEDVKGHHDEFLLYPLDILAQLNRF